jgi:hypothetical protein
MRAYRSALLGLAAVAVLTLAAGDAAFSQKLFSRGVSSNVAAKAPTRGPRISATGPSRGGYRGGRNFGGGYRGWGGPGILSVIPPGGGQYVDDPGDAPQGTNRGPQRSAQRGASGAPPANERRFVPDEVVFAVSNTVSPAQIDALQTRFRLTRLESQTFQLSGTTLYRWRGAEGNTCARS